MPSHLRAVFRLFRVNFAQPKHCTKVLQLYTVASVVSWSSALLAAAVLMSYDLCHTPSLACLQIWVRWRCRGGVKLLHPRRKRVVLVCSGMAFWCYIYTCIELCGNVCGNISLRTGVLEEQDGTVVGVSWLLHSNLVD